MLPSRVVARFQDGRMLKGTTQDFAPAKAYFHVITSEGGARPITVTFADLKAVFFVRSLIGNPAHQEQQTFSGPLQGRKVHVTFTDGEVMVGTTQGYEADRPGFWLVPADGASNNERVFVNARAVQALSFLA